MCRSLSGGRASDSKCLLLKGTILVKLTNATGDLTMKQRALRHAP